MVKVLLAILMTALRKPLPTVGGEASRGERPS